MAKVDSEDEFKRQMRRRLVGAVALVTALVVILPMLLENSPKPHEGNLELRIPDKDRSGAFTTQMVVAESAPDVTPLPPPEAEHATPPAPPQHVKPEPAPHRTEPAKGNAEKAHSGKATSGKATSGKEVPAKPASSKPVHAKPASDKSATDKSETDKAAAHKGGFAVQVGAFSHVDAARGLQTKLGKQGWHAYTQKAGGAVRVRVGPYPGRAEALRAQEKLKAQGYPAAVVTESQAG